jgi:hypothetical protein
MPVSVSDYLEPEERSEFRSEYYNGEVVARQEHRALT